MGKYDKFFALAKEAGLEEVELYISESRSLNISLFHGEVDEYKDNNGYSILARGLINGKCGSASADVWNNEKAKWLVKEMVANAKVIEMTIQSSSSKALKNTIKSILTIKS